MRHSRAVVPARRTPVRLPPPPRRPGVAPTLYRPAVTLTLRRRGIARALRPPTVAFRGLLSHAMFGGKLAAGAAAAAMGGLGIMNYQDGGRTGSGDQRAHNGT